MAFARCAEGSRIRITAGDGTLFRIDAENRLFGRLDAEERRGTVRGEQRRGKVRECGVERWMTSKWIA